MTQIINPALWAHNKQAAERYEDLSNKSGTAIFAVFSHDVKNPEAVSIFWEQHAPIDHVIRSLEKSLEVLRHMHRNNKRSDSDGKLNLPGA